MLITIQTRAAYLLGKYEQRFRKLLRQASWSEEQLADLGPGMRSAVAALPAQQQKARDRLAFLTVVASEAEDEPEGP